MTVTWNGTAITGPVLIYQDELVVDNRADPEASPVRDGTLICRSEDQVQVGWHLPGGRGVFQFSGDFRQTKTDSTATPSVSRLSVSSEDVSRDDYQTNGLWTCRLNGHATTPTPVAVGIYGRGKELTVLCTPMQGAVREDIMRWHLTSYTCSCSSYQMFEVNCTFSSPYTAGRGVISTARSIPLFLLISE